MSRRRGAAHGPVRRPLRVYAEGSDPDPRFSLANERTALAWARTALALVAGGVALTSFATVADLHRLLHVVAALLCLLGGVVAVGGLVSWQRAERAMRTGRPLPPPVMLPVLTGCVVVLALVLAVHAVTAAA